jgi:hypothetical protein
MDGSHGSCSEPLLAAGREFEERRSINRNGLRGPEVKSRPSIQKRVIVLGDSFVFGQGVGDGEARSGRPVATSKYSMAAGRATEPVSPISCSRCGCEASRPIS